jgi:hypothetical protein
MHVVTYSRDEVQVLITGSARHLGMVRPDAAWLKQSDLLWSVHSALQYTRSAN